MKQHLFAGLLIVVVALGLEACGGGSGEGSTKPTSNANESFCQKYSDFAARKDDKSDPGSPEARVQSIKALAASARAMADAAPANVKDAAEAVSTGAAGLYQAVNRSGGTQLDSPEIQDALLSTFAPAEDLATRVQGTCS